MPRLTKLEWEAVATVICERLAGGTKDLQDSIGASDSEAEKIYERLERVLDKISR